MNTFIRNAIIHYKTSIVGCMMIVGTIINTINDPSCLLTLVPYATFLAGVGFLFAPDAMPPLSQVINLPSVQMESKPVVTSTLTPIARTWTWFNRGLIVVLALTFASSASAQTLVSSQGTVGKGKNLASVLAVTVYLPPGSVTRSIASGAVYQVMVRHGLGYIMYESATDRLRQRQVRSKGAVAAKWAGRAAVGFALTLQLKWVQANDAWQRIAVGAGTVLGGLVPMFQADIPPPREWEAKLLRDDLVVAEGRSTTVIVLVPGKFEGAFEDRFPLL